MKSRDVRVWEIRINRGKTKRTYTVRWSVAGKPRSKTFATRALADQHRSELMQAVNRGEAFDSDDGLPESMAPVSSGPSWIEFAQRYISMKWPGAAAKSRDAMTDGIATVTAVLVLDLPGRPHVTMLRHAVRALMRPEALRPVELEPGLMAAWRWLERASLPLAELMNA